MRHTLAVAAPLPELWLVCVSVFQFRSDAAAAPRASPAAVRVGNAAGRDALRSCSGGSPFIIASAHPRSARGSQSVTVVRKNHAEFYWTARNFARWYSQRSPPTTVWLAPKTAGAAAGATELAPSTPRCRASPPAGLAGPNPRCRAEHRGVAASRGYTARRGD